ncbi:MAG: hypothetical protein K0S34_72 [Bacillales bacterium]|jgi:predicted transcriptional regulator|nr:hypothetical protein [Bacillales bacterium]
MNIRDKAIIDTLGKFRCMSRNDIAELFFPNTSNKEKNANAVLKRLCRDGHITVNKERRPYVYFPIPSIKLTSQKIDHFLGIVDFYKQVCDIEAPETFTVEPKYGKDYMEPDIFMIWKRGPFFVEIQRSIYSERVMKDKITRYENYFYSEKWQLEQWQPTGNKYFPTIILITNHKYKIDSQLHVRQLSDISEIL